MEHRPSRPFLCIGHRGARGHAPENTLLSIETALRLGAHWVEVDVHPLEGRLVVLHDDTVDRTTNGRGPLSSFTLEALRRLDAGRGERIPFLEEVLELLNGRAGLVVEMKGLGSAALLPAVLRRALVEGFNPGRLTVSSFHREELLAFREAALPVATAVLSSTFQEEALRFAQEMGASALHLGLRGAAPGALRRCREAGLPVYVFTVNEPEDIRRMYHGGAAGVFTDFPDRVAPALELC
ncbi:MAG: glycerophosphodiester phosphodiesterase [Acidobacteriota bacterium]